MQDRLVPKGTSAFGQISPEQCIQVLVLSCCCPLLPHKLGRVLVPQHRLYVSESAAMPLLSLPPNISTWRERLSVIDTPIELPEAHSDEIWPNVDNVWVYHRKDTWMDGIVATIYHCKARRQREAQPKVEDPKRRRNRKMRDAECRTAMVKEVKDGLVPLRRQEEPHAHSLERSDNITWSTYIRETRQDVGIYEELARQCVNTAFTQDIIAPEQTAIRFRKAQEAIEASYYRMRRGFTAMYPGHDDTVEHLMNVWIDGLLSSTRGTVKLSGTARLASASATQNGETA